MNTLRSTAQIKEKAYSLGFQNIGFAKAERLDNEARFFEKWLNQQQNGEMHYLERNFDKRIDPRLLVEGAKTVISLSYNYFTYERQKHSDAPKIAMYALGLDYHLVVKDKLEQLLAFIQEKHGNVSGRCFIDSAPVLERAWAVRAGIGWMGKNTNILTKRAGSYFFLAEIIVDIAFDYDSPVKNFCGNCTKCIDACPTDALIAPYQIDGSKCISYFTIELKDAILPGNMKSKFGNWMFGCDICQEVCPINSQAKPHNESAFKPNPVVLNMTKSDWISLQEDTFTQLFRHSPLKRTKYSGLKRNIDFLYVD